MSLIGRVCVRRKKGRFRLIDTLTGHVATNDDGKPIDRGGSTDRNALHRAMCIINDNRPGQGSPSASPPR